MRGVRRNGTSTTLPCCSRRPILDVGEFFRRLADREYVPSWHAQRIAGALGDAEKLSAQKTARHAGTPTVACFDSLGRTIVSIVDNGADAAGDSRKYVTRTLLDIEGRTRTMLDPLDRIVVGYDYDRLGRILHQTSMDAGERWIIGDVRGLPIRTWNSRHYVFRIEYDAMRRPTRHFVRGGDQYERNGGVLPCEILFEQTIYGDCDECGLTEHRQTDANLRGRVFRRFDGAGAVTTDCYDFKGNLLRSARQFARDYRATPDWSKSPRLESERFERLTVYDALNRVVTATNPDGSVHRPAYNDTGLLESIDIALRGARCDQRPMWTPFVTSIDYNARQQRAVIEYANGVNTRYEYDPLTFWLVRLTTSRPGLRDRLAARIFAKSTLLQDLHYHYDAVGNITVIGDHALRAIFHDNRRVDPICHYTYDALYRLIEVGGRQDRAQSGIQLSPAGGNYRDFPFLGAAAPGAPDQLQHYAEQYDYDPAGNFLRATHVAGDSVWTRRYAYEHPSLIDPSRNCNRLSHTSMSADSCAAHDYYLYDAHGNIVQMPHLPLMRWDFMDRLAATASQVVNCGTPETTFYAYDTNGQRVRKVTERQDGTRKEERLYVGDFERLREFGERARDLVGARDPPGHGRPAADRARRDAHDRSRRCAADPGATAAIPTQQPSGLYLSRA